MPLETWLAGSEQVLVFLVFSGSGESGCRIGHFDHLRAGAVHQFERPLDRWQELAVHQGDPGVAMIEDIGNRIGVETDVDRVEYGARRGNSEVSLGNRRDIRTNGRHDISGFDPLRRQCGRHAAAPFVDFAPVVSTVAVDKRFPLTENVPCSSKMGQW